MRKNSQRLPYLLMTPLRTLGQLPSNEEYTTNAAESESESEYQSESDIELLEGEAAKNGDLDQLTELSKKRIFREVKEANEKFLDAAEKGDLTQLQELVEEGFVDINYQNSSEHGYCGYTPLHETILNRQFAAFKLLLRLGADNNIKTGTDAAFTGIPKGLSAYELILHRYSDGYLPKETFKDMLALLTRHKLHKEGEHAFDQMKEFCEQWESEDYLPILEYELARKNKDKDFLKKDETFTDTDSEIEGGYVYKVNKKRFGTPDKPLQKKRFKVSARGIHYYKTGTSCKQRANYKAFSDAGLLTAIGMYSADAHKRADVTFSMPELTTSRSHLDFKKTLTEREEKLKCAAEQTKKALKELSNTGLVEPVLQRGTKTSRLYFLSRLIELIQRYVNSYHTFTEDIKTAQTRKPSFLRNERTRLKNTILKRLKGNPVVSTSEDIRVGLQYSFGILNYDTKDAYQPRKKLDFTLTPEYKADGDLRHPYLGIIYLTLHTQEEIEQESESIVDLFSLNEIDTNKGPGTHQTSGYIRGLERVFFGGISSDKLFFAQAVRLPNFYHPWRSFVKEKYGLTREKYKEFKSKLARFGIVNPQTKKMKNLKEFHRTEHEIIQYIIEYLKEKLVHKIQNWAQEHNFEIDDLDNVVNRLRDAETKREKYKQHEFMAKYGVQFKGEVDDDEEIVELTEQLQRSHVLSHGRR